MTKYFPYIVIGLLVLIACQSFFNTYDGITPEEEVYRLKIHDLNKEKTKLLHDNKRLNNKLKHFENEVLKNDSIIDNSTSEQLDSMFTNYFKR